MAVDHLNDRTTRLDQTAFQSAVNGQCGCLSCDGQRHDVIVRVGLLVFSLNDRGPFIQQGEQQPTSLSVKGPEFFPDAGRNQP